MSPKRQQAVEFFVKQGWTPQQSAGIVANLEAESGLRPDAVGDGGLARGIAQWHPNRREGFEALIGRPFEGSSFEDQLYWVHAELQSSEKPAGIALAACTTAAEAGACVSKRYERPADREGAAVTRAALAERIFAEWAAQDHAGAAIPVPPIPTPPDAAPSAPAAPKPPEKRMGALALLQLFGPILSGMIPQITPLLNPGAAGKVNQYAGIAQVVLDTINKTTGAPNLQGSIEAMQSNASVKAAVQQAVVSHPDVIGLLEVGGGIKEARAASVVMQTAERPFWFNPMFWISAAFFPMMYLIVASVLFTVQPTATPLTGAPWWAMVGFDQATRSGLVNLIVGMVFGGVVGVWFGTSYGSQRKTELAAASEAPK